MKKTLFISILIICTTLQAQIVNIPDPNFKNALVNTPCVIFGPPGDCGDVNATIDLNNDGEVQVAEAEIVDFLCIGFQNISSLEGIEAFVNLEYLYVYDNDLTTIDTSENLLLKILHCDSNNLSSINISQNTTLEVLRAQNNQLTEIGISGTSNLTSLNCSNNQLSSIDISNNPQLNFLAIGYNELTTIDLSQHPNFGGLIIENNNLTSIDVSQNPMLKSLDIGNNNFSSIDVSQNPLLEFLFIDENNLNTIDVSQNPLLERLYIDGNDFSSFEVSNNLLLETLSFSDSPLITGNIDLSQHSILRDLRCENTSISGLNIKNGNNQILNQLKAFNNPNLFCIDVGDPGNINLL
jgi:Leucine-rich repeat (LRR) protein